MGESAPSPGQTKLWRRFLKGSEGAAAVEFALVLNLLFLLILGMLEFGLAFSYRQVIINASREGARYGVVFRVDAQGNRIPPTQLTPPIGQFVLSTAGGGLGLTNILPANTNPTVTVVPQGNNLQVTVTCNYPFWVMNQLLPVLGSNLTLTGTTVMRIE
jgi:Flp pilus assembly protein TadG